MLTDQEREEGNLAWRHGFESRKDFVARAAEVSDEVAHIAVAAALHRATPQDLVEYARTLRDVNSRLADGKAVVFGIFGHSRLQIGVATSPFRLSSPLTARVAPLLSVTTSGSMSLELFGSPQRASGSVAATNEPRQMNFFAGHRLIDDDVRAVVGASANFPVQRPGVFGREAVIEFLSHWAALDLTPPVEIQGPKPGQLVVRRAAPKVRQPPQRRPVPYEQSAPVLALSVLSAMHYDGRSMTDGLVNPEVAKLIKRESLRAAADALTAYVQGRPEPLAVLPARLVGTLLGDEDFPQILSRVCENLAEGGRLADNPALFADDKSVNDNVRRGAREGFGALVDATHRSAVECEFFVLADLPPPTPALGGCHALPGC